MFSQGADRLSFGFFADRPVVVRRHPGPLCSDAGWLPLREFDERRQYTARLAACLSDTRAAPDHTAVSMLRQRLYGILADQEDGNDHDALCHDPIFKLPAGELPADDPLAAQPTLSRFENAVTIPALWNLLDFLVDTGIEHLRTARPDIAIHARADSGFGVPWMYEVCEKNGISYTFGIAGNKRLETHAQGLMDQAKALYEQTADQGRGRAHGHYPPRDRATGRTPALRGLLFRRP